MDTQHVQFPFSGLHVYQLMQEAWTHTRHDGKDDHLRSLLETEVCRAVLRIARATARSGRHSYFRAQLENARGAIHTAGAIADQLARRGTPVHEDLQELLVDAARMLGALIRTLQATQAGSAPAGPNGTGAPVEA